MFEEKLACGSSWVHRLDPRVKIIITFFAAFFIALSADLNVLFYFLVASILLFLSARIKLRAVLKKLLTINFFILIVWIFIPFTFPGQTVFTFWSLEASKEGLFYALKITLRSNAIMLLIISLLSTSTVSNLIHAMSRLKVPAKLIYLFFFVYRYLHVIKTEFDSLYKAMLLRGFKAKTNLHTYKSYAYLIAVLLIKSYERSQKIYEAMLCRGFKGSFAIFDEFQLKQNDFIFIFSASLLIIILFTVEKGWL